MSDSAAAHSRDESTAVRLVRVAGSLASVHLEHAQREAMRDKDRIVTGVALGFAAAVILALLTAMAHVGVACLLHEHGVVWSRAMFFVGGADGIVAIALVLSARRRLRAPILSETRALVRRTVQAARGA